MEKRIGIVFIFLLVVLLSSFVLAQDLNEEEEINGETRFTAPELFEDQTEDSIDVFENSATGIVDSLGDDVGQDRGVENSEGGLGSEKGNSSNWLFYGVGIVIVIAVTTLIWLWKKRIY